MPMIQMGHQSGSSLDRPQEDYVRIFAEKNTKDGIIYLFAKKHDGSIAPLEKLPPNNSFGFETEDNYTDFYNEGRLIYSLGNHIGVDEQGYDTYQITGSELYAFSQYEEGFNLLVRFDKGNHNNVKVTINDLPFQKLTVSQDILLQSEFFKDGDILHLVYDGCGFRVLNHYSAGTSGGSFGFTEVTYSEFLTLVSLKELNPGTLYIITDYQYKYNIPYSQVKNTTGYVNEMYASDEERIVIFAVTTEDTIFSGFSLDHPTDDFLYDPFYNENGFEKGIMRERRDRSRNITLPFDFRNAVVRRWENYLREPTYILPTWEIDFAGFDLNKGLFLNSIDFHLNGNEETSMLNLEIDEELKLINLPKRLKEYSYIEQYFNIYWMHTKLIIAHKESWDWKKIKISNVHFKATVRSKTEHPEEMIISAGNREEFIEASAVEGNVKNITYKDFYHSVYYKWDMPNVLLYNKEMTTTVSNIEIGNGCRDLHLANGTQNMKIGHECSHIYSQKGSKNCEIGNECSYIWMNNSNSETKIFNKSSNIILMNYASQNEVGSHSSNNVFFAKSKFNVLDERCHFNTFREETESNILGRESNYNYFDERSCYNKLGDECDHNQFGKDNNENIMLSSCHHNVYEDDSCKNLMGYNNVQNYLGRACIDNRFGSYCKNIFIDYSSSDNTFGNFCENNELGRAAISNQFGDYCSDNKTGSSFQYNRAEDHFRENIIQENVKSNEFGYAFQSNTIDGECDKNTFGKSCNGNYIGKYFHENTWGDSCVNNYITSNFGNNTFESDCKLNHFGIHTSNNYLASHCMNNTFIDDCRFNHLGSGTANNVFSSRFKYNRLGRGCIDNIFGLDCTHNFIGERVENVIFGHTFNNNNIGNEMYNVTFMNDCDHNHIKDQCKHVYFGEGCMGNDIGYRFQGYDRGNRTEIGRFFQNNKIGNDARWLTFPDHFSDNIIEINRLNFNKVDMTPLTIIGSSSEEFIQRKKLNWEYSTFEVDLDYSNAIVDQMLQLYQYNEWVGIFNFIDTGKLDHQPTITINITAIMGGPRWMVELRPKRNVMLCVNHTGHEIEEGHGFPDNIALKDNQPRVDLDGGRGDWIQFRYDHQMKIWFEYNRGQY